MGRGNNINLFRVNPFKSASVNIVVLFLITYLIIIIGGGTVMKEVLFEALTSNKSEIRIMYHAVCQLDSIYHLLMDYMILWSVSL